MSYLIRRLDLSIRIFYSMSPNAGLYDFDLRKFHFGSLQKAEFELELQTIGDKPFRYYFDCTERYFPLKSVVGSP